MIFIEPQGPQAKNPVAEETKGCKAMNSFV